MNKNENINRHKILLSRIKRADNLSMLLVLIVYITIIFLINPRFLSWLNVKNVLVQVSITGILSLGTLTVIMSGGIDLSIGNMVSFLGCGMAYLMVITDWPIWIIVPLVVVTALLLEGLMGFIISRTKVEPFIISLGFMSIYQGFTFLITNGSEIIIGDRFKLLGKTFPLDIGMPVYIFAALTFILWLILKYTKFGRRVYAVGNNEDAAYLAGINVKKLKIGIYMLNGLLISIAAMTLMSRLGSGNPNMGAGREIETIAAVVVGGTALSGGKGSVMGIVIGVLLLGSISNSMNIIGVSSYWQFSLRGALIVSAVVINYYSSKRQVSLKK